MTSRLKNIVFSLSVVFSSFSRISFVYGIFSVSGICSRRKFGRGLLIFALKRVVGRVLIICVVFLWFVNNISVIFITVLGLNAALNFFFGSFIVFFFNSRLSRC